MPGGPLSKSLDGYEHRAQQVEMAQAIASAIAERKHLIVEAGTGVGKSLAYLLPAFFPARRGKEPAIISTYTINLQEQLLRKDIPLLESALGANVSAAAAKGRANYLCLRRLRAAQRTQPTLFEEHGIEEQLVRIVEWGFETHDGSLSDLDLRPAPQLWEQVNSTRYTCVGKSCQMSEACFFRKARQRLRQVQIVVANHYLYFTDLGCPDSAQQVLPKHPCVIFDEAHTLEDVASECLGLAVSQRGVLHLLERLAGSEKRRGLLQSCRSGDLLASAKGVQKAAAGFFSSVRDWAQHSAPENMRIYEPIPVEDTLSEPLHRLASGLADSSKAMDDDDLAAEIMGYAIEVSESAQAARIITSMGLDGHVYWVQKERKDTVLRSAPVRVSELLSQVLFSRIPTSILTGATLAVGKERAFAFLRDRLGLGNAHELRLGSPFDYRTQAVIYVEKGLPPPENPDYIPAISQAMKGYLKETRGRALVLFTSYENMRMVSERLAPFIEEQGWRLLVQGAGMSRARLLEAFQKEGDCVLFGTASFWQGVDVPGEALSNVIITRLPFAVPTQPLQQARLEEITARGKDAFESYSLPQAVIRLKQGVGRLIRSKADRGIIVILDSRVATRRYGRTFLASLPPCRVVVNE